MALQWTPLRLIMTGDNGLDRRRSEHIYNEYRYRGGVRMLDKEVQYNPAEFMDYEGADSGLGGSGDLATVTVVEINNSPTAIYGDHASPLSNPAFSYNSGSDNNNSNNINNNNSSVLSESNVNEHGHNNSIIRRDSIEKLHELQENNEGDCLPDATDYSTLPAAYRIGSLLDNSKVDNDVVDEIKEQSSLVVLNNTAINDEKLKELSEKSDDSSCALDCLSFTIQCCDCTIL